VEVIVPRSELTKRISVSGIETRPEFHGWNGGKTEANDKRHSCGHSPQGKVGGSGHARRKEVTATITNRRDALESRESSIGDVEFEER
jgi:hypothetical protein